MTPFGEFNCRFNEARPAESDTHRSVVHCPSLAYSCPTIPSARTRTTQRTAFTHSARISLRVSLTHSLSATQLFAPPSRRVDPATAPKSPCIPADTLSRIFVSVLLEAFPCSFSLRSFVPAWQDSWCTRQYLPLSSLQLRVGQR